MSRRDRANDTALEVYAWEKILEGNATSEQSLECYPFDGGCSWPRWVALVARLLGPRPRRRRVRPAAKGLPFDGIEELQSP
ncbi:MAG: hypothetical protein ACPG4T_20840 [Nannocystaceae bacterium]